MGREQVATRSLWGGGYSSRGRTPFRLSEEALILIGGHISVRDEAARRLEATIPFSFKSFGERVQVELLGVDGDVLVLVKSASRMPTTLAD